MSGTESERGRSDYLLDEIGPELDVRAVYDLDAGMTHAVSMTHSYKLVRIRSVRRIDQADVWNQPSALGIVDHDDAQRIKQPTRACNGKEHDTRSYGSSSRGTLRSFSSTCERA